LECIVLKKSSRDSFSPDSTSVWINCEAIVDFRADEDV